MKRGQAQVGMLVVTSNHDTATVYTIKEIVQNGAGVHLVYPMYSGGEASGGWVDYSMVSIPTKKQFRNTIDDIHQHLYNYPVDSHLMPYFLTLKNIVGWK